MYISEPLVAYIAELFEWMAGQTSGSYVDLSPSFRLLQSQAIKLRTFNALDGTHISYVASVCWFTCYWIRTCSVGMFRACGRREGLHRVKGVSKSNPTSISHEDFVDLRNLRSILPLATGLNGLT